MNILSLLPNVTINVEGKPYLTRYTLFSVPGKNGAIFLHHFHSSDKADGDLHNHPWKWAQSLILKGGYYEKKCYAPFIPVYGLEPEVHTYTDIKLPFWKPSKRPLSTIFDNLKHGNFLRLLPIAFYYAHFNLITRVTFHQVRLINEEAGSWSLFIAGPRVTEWGFLNTKTGMYTDWRENPEAIP